MEEKTLFEIPIYSMSETDFNNRWKKKKERLIQIFLERENTRENALKYLPILIKDKDIWKYNQIIGYIKISVTRQEVRFKVYKPINATQYRIDRTSRYVIKELLNTGLHFYAIPLTEEEIKLKIREYLQSIERKYLKKTILCRLFSF